jgi:hypothetical protein
VAMTVRAAAAVAMTVRPHPAPPGQLEKHRPAKDPKYTSDHLPDLHAASLCC